MAIYKIPRKDVDIKQKVDHMKGIYRKEIYYIPIRMKHVHNVVSQQPNLPDAAYII